MKVELTNGRQFIVKVNYLDTLKIKREKDQFDRDVNIEWFEKTTIITVKEYFKIEKMCNTVVVGKAHCNYHDKFDKKVGKGIAYFRALSKLKELNIVNEDEYKELCAFKLDKHFELITVINKENK